MRESPRSISRRARNSPLPYRPGDAMAVARFRITERQVLLFIMAASILAYIGAIFVVTFRQKGQQPDLSRPARVRWMNPQAAAQRSPDIRYIIADFLDPSLMSLPSAHGFSRRTWEGQPTAKYLPPEPPVELAFLDAGTSAAMESLLDELSVPEAVRASVEKLAIQPDRPSAPQPAEYDGRRVHGGTRAAQADGAARTSDDHEREVAVPNPGAPCGRPGWCGAVRDARAFVRQHTRGRTGVGDRAPPPV